MGCSSVWVAHAILGQNHIKRIWVALQCGLLMPILFKTILKGMGYSSVWVAYAILGQSSMNRHGLLFSLGYSCHLGQTRMNGHIKRTWVALQCGLLMPIWVKTILKRHGLLFSMGCSSCFGSNYYKKDVGCSSVWVAHVKIHFYVRLQSLP